MRKCHRIQNAAWRAIVAGLMFIQMLGFVACGADPHSAHPRPPAEPSAATLVQQYGGRAPRPCPAITHWPSDAEAAVLAQCTMEGLFGDTETLLTDVRVRLKADALTLIGHAKHYACGAQSFSPGRNCTMTEMPNSPGACWKTDYGEYRCNFVNAGEGYHPFVPPPTGY